MAKNIKLPKTPSSEPETISIDQIVESVALNRHCEISTAYYLLHKKWLNDLSREEARARRNNCLPSCFDSCDGSNETPSNKIGSLIPVNENNY
jgi:hypothetical protein